MRPPSRKSGDSAYCGGHGMAAVTASSPPDLLPKVERPPIALTGSLILRSLYPTPGNPVMPRPSSVTSTNQRQGASLQIWREGIGHLGCRLGR